MVQSGNENIVWHAHSVARTHRETVQGHRGAVIWFTGLSGSGKSTLADSLERALFARGIRTYEVPVDPEIHLDGLQTVADLVETLVIQLRQRRIFR